jgi:hypothetical protein
MIDKLIMELTRYWFEVWLSFFYAPIRKPVPIKSKAESVTRWGCKR